MRIGTSGDGQRVRPSGLWSEIPQARAPALQIFLKHSRRRSEKAKPHYGSTEKTKGIADIGITNLTTDKHG